MDKVRGIYDNAILIKANNNVGTFSFEHPTSEPLEHSLDSERIIKNNPKHTAVPPTTGAPCPILSSSPTPEWQGWTTSTSTPSLWGSSAWPFWCPSGCPCPSGGCSSKGTGQSPATPSHSGQRGRGWRGLETRLWSWHRMERRTGAGDCAPGMTSFTLADSSGEASESPTHPGIYCIIIFHVIQSFRYTFLSFNSMFLCDLIPYVIERVVFWVVRTYCLCI